MPLAFGNSVLVCCSSALAFIGRYVLVYCSSMLSVVGISVLVCCSAAPMLSAPLCTSPAFDSDYPTTDINRISMIPKAMKSGYR